MAALQQELEARRSAAATSIQVCNSGWGFQWQHVSGIKNSVYALDGGSSFYVRRLNEDGLVPTLASAGHGAHEVSTAGCQAAACSSADPTGSSQVLASKEASTSAACREGS